MSSLPYETHLAKTFYTKAMKPFLYLHALLILLLFLMYAIPSVATPAKKILVLKIRQEIGPEAKHYVLLGLAQAKKDNCDVILVDMDTFGGALDAADEIRKAFLDFDKPVLVFINKNAASAGALISIACDSIYMASGSNIGAATVVTQDGTPAPDKYQSYMRSLMRSTAQANKRDPQVAERMVGVLTGKDSLVISKVLSFSTQEAISHHYCEAIVSSIAEILVRNKITNYTLSTYELPVLEKTIAFFLSPYLRSILILLIIAGIYFELQSPGIGFALLTSIVAALLYFIPSYMNGLAENWEILVFLAGLILIILEIFVIPGFGIVGIAGILCTLSALVLVMLNNNAFDFTFVNTTAISEALMVLFIAIIGGILFIFFAGPKLMGSALFKRVTLQESLATAEGYTSNFNKENMVGKRGSAYTVLRPSGKVEIDGIIYDAYSQGDFIERGAGIVVVDHMATSLKVKITPLQH